MVEVFARSGEDLGAWVLGNRAPAQLGCLRTVATLVRPEAAAAVAASGLLAALARLVQQEASSLCAAGDETPAAPVIVFQFVADVLGGLLDAASADAAAAVLATAPQLLLPDLARVVALTAGSSNEGRARAHGAAQRLMRLLAGDGAPGDAPAAASAVAPDEGGRGGGSVPVPEPEPVQQAALPQAGGPQAGGQPLPQACSHCGRVPDAAAGEVLPRCAGCKSRRYCGEACARAAWAAGDRAECKALAAAHAAAARSGGGS